MTREILFRGKSISTGEWIQGDGIHYPKSINYLGTCWIDGMENRANDWIQVDPATVGQFTGLCDKNGVKIFEGDVVASDAWCCKCHVVYMDGGFTLKEGETAENLGANFCDSYGYELDDVKVIGNIHDNPELLEEESE